MNSLDDLSPVGRNRSGWFALYTLLGFALCTSAYAQMVPAPMHQDLWRGVSANLARRDRDMAPALATLPPFDAGSLHALGDH